MTYWLYDPKKLVSPGTFLFYNIRDLGDLMNFLTISVAFFYFYFRKKNQLKEKSRMLITVFSVVMIMGLLFGGNKTTLESIDGVRLPKFTDYKYALSID